MTTVPAYARAARAAEVVDKRSSLAGPVAALAGVRMER
jgi:hypothetical protein